MLKKIDLTDYHLDLIKRSAGLGLTQEDIAHLVGISYGTFKNWLKEDEHIRYIYESGKAGAKLKVAQKLMDKINDGDVACILFYLKCQCGWRENVKVNITDKTKPVIYLPEKNLDNN